MATRREFRLLVDCVPLMCGGGVQVAIAFLANLATTSGILWRAILPISMRDLLPNELTADSRLVFVRKRPPVDRLWLFLTLQRAEREFSPDVVFTVFGPPYFRARAPHVVGFALPNLIYPVPASLGAPTIVGRLGDRFRMALFRRADCLIVETETVRSRLSAALRIDRNKISVIGNGVNPVLQRISDFERSQKPSTECFGFLIPSAYYKHKNLEITPKVAAVMRRIDPELDFEFRLTLDPTEESWLSIRAEAERLGVADRVMTLGALPLTMLARAYMEASAVFLPTLLEVSTAVYPESFFFRRPLVTSDIDFAVELCDDAAIFVPPLDAETIAETLVEVARKPEIGRRLVEAGETRLKRAYPEPSEKFGAQIDLLLSVARNVRSRPPEFDDGRRAVDACTSISLGMKAAEREAEEARSRDPRKSEPDSAIALHDALASEWDAKYATGGFRRRSAFFEREILPLLPPAGHWLDAGCGSGHFGRLLAARGTRVCGVDGSARMISTAADLAAKSEHAESLHFQPIATVERLPFADRSFSGCICLSVLEYLDRPFAALDELVRVLEPSGTLVFSAPDSRSWLRGLQRTVVGVFGRPRNWSQYGKFSRFALTPFEIESELSLRGMVVRKMASFDVLLPELLHGYLAASLNYVVAQKAGPSKI